MNVKILVIDDEEGIRFTFKGFLKNLGYEVDTASDYNEAMAAISEKEYSLIFADIFMKDMSGIDVLREVKSRNLTCPVVIITGIPDIKTASDALRLGAFDYICKPVQRETLVRIAEMALQHKALIDEKERYRSNLEAIFRSVRDGIITVDKELKVIETNDAVSYICGLLQNNIKGNVFNSITTNCGRGCIDALNETIKKGEPVKIYRLECKHIQHPDQIVTVTAYPLVDNNGAYGGAVLTIRDETQLVALEQEVKEFHQFYNIIGKNEEMQKIYSLIEDLTDVDTTVLVTGESGTGKELIAEALHYMGNRSHKPMVKVNCSALSEELLESELFGHVKGSFTGALKDRIGRFQMADGGTIFLDEIGDISQRIQLKLLRVLQEKEFERVGESNSIRVDVRIVAATNQDIKEKVESGKIREDLYYRLKVMDINLPPLRERREDISLLTNHFLKKFNTKLSKEIAGISEDVKRVFMNYPWPGNVRELEHAIEHAFIRCHQKIITSEHLPADLKNFTQDAEERIENEPQKILQALEKTAWNKTTSARMLGMSRRTIYRKIEEYGLNKISAE